MVLGLELATGMVVDICGGTPSTITSGGEVHIPDRVIDFPLEEVSRLAGLELPFAEIKRVLSRLGFFTAGAGPVIKVAVPTWRPDVHGKADIVEEIVRIVGVDRIPMTPFERGDSGRKPVLTALQNRTRKARRALAARGLLEGVTRSFVSKPQAELFGGGKPSLGRAPPIFAHTHQPPPGLTPARAPP